MGTRLREITGELPKPLVPVDGVPLLRRTLELLGRHGITEIILAAGHRGEVIRDYFVANPVPGLEVRTHIEQLPLGTSGALRELAPQLKDDFLLLYGDIFLDLNLGPILEQHVRRAAAATLVVRQSDHPHDSHLVEVNSAGQATGFVLRQEPGRLYRNVANAAIYVLSKVAVDFVPGDRASDFVRDVFPAMVQAGLPVETYWLPSGEYVKDMGTPERLAQVEKYLRQRALIENVSRERKPIRVAFLDRDGVLNVDRKNVHRVEDFELLAGAAEGVRLLNDAGILTVVVTNQPVLARGLCDEATLDAIHQRLRDELGRTGARLDALYYCPHHPETHHAGGRRELRRACDCRKPNIGMILQAQAELGLDLREAVMIGDSAVDLQAGKRAGLRTILIGLPGSELAPEADHVFGDLASAARAIVGGRLEREF